MHDRQNIVNNQVKISVTKVGPAGMKMIKQQNVDWERIPFVDKPLYMGYKCVLVI